MKQSDGFIRDKHNPGAVINTDNAALKSYKLQKAKQKKLDNQLNEIENVKNEVKEMKQMLNLILERLK